MRKWHKLAQKDRIPVFRIGNQWRFRLKNYIEVEKRRAGGTVRLYTSSINRFNSFVGKDPLEVLPKDVHGWMGHLKRDRNCKNSTIVNKISAIRSFYRFLMREEVIEKDPTFLVENPATEKRMPVFLTEEEVNRFLDEVSRCSYNERGKLDYAIFSLLYYTELRISELVNLRFKDIQQTEQGTCLKIIGKGNKGENLRKIQDLLGHTSLATTQLYTHTSVGGLKEAVERL